LSTRSTEHATFVLHRTYAAPPAMVFAAWTSVEAKQAWWGPPGGGLEIDLDFSVGGRERFVVKGPGGAEFAYQALYQDIVPDERIVYTYEMYKDGERISVSVATIELAADGPGTALALTEQGVFLDGHDTPALREEGTQALLEQLAGVLERA
jgi:uncharacterized protein YndB with AHSA1/START domain